MTNIEVFQDQSKAFAFAQEYAQKHRITTQITRQQNSWAVQAKERRQHVTRPQPEGPSAPASPKPQTMPESEKQRLSRFQVVEDLLHLADPKERERRLQDLCTRWGGKVASARRILREVTGKPQDRKKLPGKVRRRLRERGIHQFEYLSAARRCAMQTCQTSGMPHFAAVGKHTERGDFWVFVDTMPGYENPVALIEIYRKSDSQVGWWCQRLDTPTYIPTWDIELRDPATGDILHIHRRGISGEAVALRTLSETPNFELIDVVEADADWAEALPYDTVEAIVADSEDDGHSS